MGDSCYGRDAVSLLQIHDQYALGCSTRARDRLHLGAQDNPTGWTDWAGLDEDPDFTAQVRDLIRLRRELPLLRQARYNHGRMPTDLGWCDIVWLRPDGERMRDEDWAETQRLILLFACHDDQKDASPVVEATAILFNAAAGDTQFALPEGLPERWTMRFSSSGELSPMASAAAVWTIPGRSIALLSAQSDS